MKLLDKIRMLVFHFDRSFSGGIWKQLYWLLVISFLVITLLFGCSIVMLPLDWEANYANQLLTRLFNFVCVFTGKGSLSSIDPTWKWMALLVAIIGTILFSSSLISVMSNMLARRIERYKEGQIAYAFRNHIVIIGYDDRVPSLINQLYSDSKNKKRYFVVMSNQPSKLISNRIQIGTDDEVYNWIVVQNGSPNSLEDLRKLHSYKAKMVYLLGDENEEDRDSLNVDCLKKMVSIHKHYKSASIIPFNVFFENQTTFSAFQVTDLASEWREYIDFRPINFCEEWAKRILVSRTYRNATEQIDYPPLDRIPIVDTSKESVHLLIIGMTEMGFAIAKETAQTIHFPNFCIDRRKKTRITFLDNHADSLKDVFITRNKHFFELSGYYYRDMNVPAIHSSDNALYHEVLCEHGFIDAYFEFIKGNTTDYNVQQLIKEWTNNKDHFSIVVCTDHLNQNMEIGLYLPDSVYERNIPVLIQQENTGALLTMLNSKNREEMVHKYSHVLPFGMKDGGYEHDDKYIYIAQCINYIYEYFGKNGEIPIAFIEKEELRKRWLQLSVATQWSNLYAAYTLEHKVRILKHATTPESALYELMSEVEHNRWNSEKLLLGYRTPTDEERIWMESDKEKAKIYKQKYYVHMDIRPYEELKDFIKDYDRCMIKAIPLLVDELSECDVFI